MPIEDIYAALTSENGSSLVFNFELMQKETARNPTKCEKRKFERGR